MFIYSYLQVLTYVLGAQQTVNASGQRFLQEKGNLLYRKFYNTLTFHLPLIFVSSKARVIRVVVFLIINI